MNDKTEVSWGGVFSVCPSRASSHYGGRTSRYRPRRRDGSGTRVCWRLLVELAPGDFAAAAGELPEALHFPRLELSELGPAQFEFLK